MRSLGLVLWASITLSTVLPLTRLTAQVVNPADAQRPDAQRPDAQQLAEPKSTSGQRPPDEPKAQEERLRSWELPAITVTGAASAQIREEDRVGSYGQPRWTATRRFPGTRVYVVPEGKVEFEYWLRPTFERNEPTETRHLWELEFGLPYRFQLDLYYRIDQEGDEGEWEHGEQVELRYALADWGVIPGNPTFYLEWVSLEKRPDKIEPKLLLGGELAPRWHWGLNFVAEVELGGEKEHEYQVTGGVSYSILDSKLSAGVEAIAMMADVDGDRGDFSESEAVFVGPSVQFRPLPQTTFNLAPLFGVTDDSPDARVFINFAYEF